MFPNSDNLCVPDNVQVRLRQPVPSWTQTTYPGCPNWRMSKSDNVWVANCPHYANLDNLSRLLDKVQVKNFLLGGGLTHTTWVTLTQTMSKSDIVQVTPPCQQKNVQLGTLSKQDRLSESNIVCIILNLSWTLCEMDNVKVENFFASRGGGNPDNVQLVQVRVTQIGFLGSPPPPQVTENFQLGHFLTGALPDWDKCCLPMYAARSWLSTWKSGQLWYDNVTVHKTSGCFPQMVQWLALWQGRWGGGAGRDKATVTLVCSNQWN